MTGDAAHWQRLSALFDAAVDLDAAGRAAAVRAAADEDPALADALARMLTADDATSAMDAGAAAWIDADGGAGRTADVDADLHDDDPQDDGLRLGAWRLGPRIGRGGMGVVHVAARDDDPAQRVAIKRLRRRWDGSLQAQRFLQERRILARLAHPNIPHLVDHGVDDDARPWFALEFVDGSDIVAWADARQLPLRTRIALFRQACAAVQHAHARFVVHRDLKPANVLVDTEGRVRVLDFGVAKRIDGDAGDTATGAFAGFTPEYAAPEQLSGGTITAATDVYALGVLLYQLMSGRLPYAVDAADLRATAEAITSRSADRLEQAITAGTPHEVDARLAERDTDLRGFRRFVRGDLWRILQTALAKEPERRYASVQALSDDLGRLLDDRPVSVSGDTFAYRTGKFVRRHRGSVAMASIALVAALAGIVGVATQTLEARRQAALAERQAVRAERVRDFSLQLLSDANPANAGFGGDAKRVLAQAATRLVDQFGNEPELLAQTADVLASTMSDLGDKAGATRLLQDTRKALVASAGAPPWTLAMVDTRMSQETMAKGDPAATDALLDSAIRTLDPGDPVQARVLADTWQIRAFLRVQQGRVPDAQAAARQAVASVRDVLPARSREVVHAQHTLLIVMATTPVADAAAALAEGRRIVDDTRAFYGDAHPVTQRALKYQAMLQQGNGDVAGAEATYLQLVEQAAGTGSEPIVLQELGSLYDDADRLRESGDVYRRAFASPHERREADDHSLIAAHNNSAFQRYRIGDWTGAATEFGEAGDAWARIHASETQPYVLSARTRQADSLVEAGRLEDAGKLLHDLLPRLQAHDATFLPLGLAVRAKLALARGDIATARDDVAAALAAAPKGELSPRSLAALHAVDARVAIAGADVTRARGAIAKGEELLVSGDAWRTPERARFAQLALQLPAEATTPARCTALFAARGDAPATGDLPFQSALRTAMARCPASRGGP